MVKEPSMSSLFNKLDLLHVHENATNRNKSCQIITHAEILANQKCELHLVRVIAIGVLRTVRSFHDD